MYHADQDHIILTTLNGFNIDYPVTACVNTLYKADSSQKFIDWSKIPKFLFLPIPPIPLILIVFMIIHGNSSARAVIITLLILSLLFGLLLMNWVDDFNNSAGIG